LKEWSWPERGADAEKASFEFQAERFKRGVIPTDYALGVVKDMLLKQYPKSVPLTWDNDVVLGNLVADVMLSAVNARSTPGVPLCVLAPTNAKLFASHRDLVLQCVKQRLTLLSQTSPSVLAKMSASQRVRAGYVDPIRVFIKKEPHNRLKVAQKRLRIICSVSIVDQIIERILHTAQNEAEIQNWRFIPSKPGASMCKDEDVQDFAREVFARKNLVDVDISGFDWSVQGWELFFDALIRCELAIGASVPWNRAVMNRVNCLARAVFVFADGECVEQLEDALQKSGSFNTASTNSRIKVALAYLIGASYVAAYGDDAIEDKVSGGPEFYAELGHPVKSYNDCGDTILFCSSRIRKDGSWEPETWDKTFYRFLNQGDVSRGLWLQFLYTLRHCPHLGRIRDFLRSAGGVLGERINGWENEEEEWWPEEGCQEGG